MIKSTKAIKLLLLGSVAMTVASCRNDGDTGSGEEQHVYETNAQCSALNDSQIDCSAAEKKAKEEHVQTAPKYATKAACEEEHGTCETVPAGVPALVGPASTQTVVQHEGGSSFMPMMMGYMIGRNLSDSHPVYIDRDRDDRSKSVVVTPARSGGTTTLATVANRDIKPGSLGESMKSSTTTSVRAGFGGKAIGSVGG